MTPAEHVCWSCTTLAGDTLPCRCFAASPTDRALLQSQADRAEGVGFGLVVGEGS